MTPIDPAGGRNASFIVMAEKLLIDSHVRPKTQAHLWPDHTPTRWLKKERDNAARVVLALTGIGWSRWDIAVAFGFRSHTPIIDLARHAASRGLLAVLIPTR